MKKTTLLSITLFLFGIFTLQAQEMTSKEKTGYAVGVMLSEKIKGSEFKSKIEPIKELLAGGFLESLRAGVRDAMNDEIKLSKEEIMTLLEGVQEKIKALQQNENENVSQSTISYQSAIAQTQNRLSWFYLFTKEYAKSEQYAHMALESDNSCIVPKTNLAHALLFQNRFSEAEAVYKELSQTIVNGNETYSKVLLNDLKELEDADAIPENCKADVEKIRQILQR